ncbi:hypothetical protein R1flu_007975 [Riccia fluitans]|uniref:Integrase zinc-binding domain-containing protein n=1 Tax=Riccia fluitans TaxID=41844 RepID=A0ABD1YAK5_9MARC
MGQPEVNLKLHKLWEQETEGVEDSIKAYCKGCAIMRNHMKTKQREQSLQISQIDELGRKLKACHEALDLIPLKNKKLKFSNWKPKKENRNTLVIDWFGFGLGPDTLL